MGGEFLGESLIFLISQPRAGSTLLQRILAGYSSIETMAEPWLMLHPVYALRGDGLQAEYDASGAYDGLTDFLTHCADGESTYLQAIRALAQVLYGRALADTESQFFLDKTPRYYFIIPELRRLFPRAKFIFLIRNPLAVLSSILSTWVKEEWPVLALFRHDLLLAPRRILEGIELLGKDATVVCYEEMVAAPQDTVSSICSRLGLDFTEELLHYGARPASRGRFGDSVGLVKHSAPSTESLDKWKRLSEQEQTKHFARAYLDALGPDIVDALGYSWQELDDALDGLGETSRDPTVLWQTVIRPVESWTRRERLVYERTIAMRQEGALRGTLSFAARKVGHVARSLRSV